MAATYVQPTLAEFTAALPGFQAITVDGTKEVVLARRVDRDGMALSLRVYTTLEHGVGRACGEDAIRVSVHFRNAEGRVVRIGGSRRVNRTAGWASRVQERVAHWVDLLGPSCPTCGGPTVEREGKFGPFFGCANYPTCRGLVRILPPKNFTKGTT